MRDSGEVLDHVGFAIADDERTLGAKLLLEFSGAAAGFGKDDGRRPFFFIEAHRDPARGRAVCHDPA